MSSGQRLSLRRVISAFFTAIRLTLRGETVKSADERATDRAIARYPNVMAWMETTRTLIDQIDAAGGSALSDLHIKVDKRDMKARTMLDTIRFHAVQEYPYLLKNESPYSLIGIQATNLNDRHWVMLLTQVNELPESVKALIIRLGTHLETVPNDQAMAETPRS